MELGGFPEAAPRPYSIALTSCRVTCLSPTSETRGPTLGRLIGHHEVDSLICDLLVGFGTVAGDSVRVEICRLGSNTSTTWKRSCVLVGVIRPVQQHLHKQLGGQNAIFGVEQRGRYQTSNQYDLGIGI
jgi:hypothetical protein